jgi:Leucine-rich repeat (LRR) protein
MTALPDVITRLPALATLRCSTSLTGLPQSLRDLRTLRGLYLGFSLNKGAMLSSYDDTKHMKPLPKVLAELTELEHLDLDCCGVVDAAPLTALTKLRSLSLKWSAISGVDDIAKLTALEELSLEHCDRVADLAPLAALTKLRVLNLDNTRPKSLDVIRSLPALRELHVESIAAKRIDAIYDLELDLHADDEIVARYAARAKLRALPPIGDIVARLDGADVSVVAAALEQLAEWVLASSTRDTNAIAVAFGLQPADAEGEGDDDDDTDDDTDDDDDDEDDDDEA